MLVQNRDEDDPINEGRIDDDKRTASLLRTF